MAPPPPRCDDITARRSRLARRAQVTSRSDAIPPAGPRQDGVARVRRRRAGPVGTAGGDRGTAEQRGRGPQVLGGTGGPQVLSGAAGLGRRRYRRGSRGPQVPGGGSRGWTSPLPLLPGQGPSAPARYSRSEVPALAPGLDRRNKEGEGGVTLLSPKLLLSSSFRDCRSQGNVFLPSNP